MKAGTSVTSVPYPARLTEAFQKDLWVNGFCYRSSIGLWGLLKDEIFFFFLNTGHKMTLGTHVLNK